LSRKPDVYDKRKRNATSTGWNNYRHQADALAQYQMLKGFGFGDDRIILILEDDIAGNPSNPYPGVVHVTADGENLRSTTEEYFRKQKLQSQ
jgi:glycosylphosphatidylinositol transamidase (GPIT) subunit GPI8